MAKNKRKWDISVGPAELGKDEVVIGSARNIKKLPKYDVTLGPTMIHGDAELLSDEDTDDIIHREALKHLQRKLR